MKVMDCYQEYLEEQNAGGKRFIHIKKPDPVITAAYTARVRKEVHFGEPIEPIVMSTIIANWNNILEERRRNETT